MSTINSNTEQTLGLVYQFWVALEKCVELLPGESLLIEVEGDVSIEGRFQLELKHMSEGDKLTSSDLNIWNTLKNWMDDGFDHSKYRNLVLRTTQSHGTHSIFKNWNFENDGEKRVDLLASWAASREGAYDTKVQKALSANEPKIPGVPESLQLMREVISVAKRGRLKEIASKFYIEAQAPDLDGTYQALKTRLCHNIPNSNLNAYLDALAGYIIRPLATGNDRWEITYEKFKEQCEELGGIHCRQSKRFPTKYRARFGAPLTEEQEKLQKNLFVVKIKDIEHHERIVSAIKDYSFAFGVALDDFNSYDVAAKAYEQFSDDVERRFYEAYSRASRQTTRCSKDFYDEHTASQSPDFSGFDATPTDFRNGVLHMHMNDKTRSYQWNLNP